MTSSDMPKVYKLPGTDLRGKEKPNRSVEVRVGVSYLYNGGTLIDGEWYQGYEVAPAIVPEGYELTSLGVGLQFNAHPPYATLLLRPKQTLEKMR